MNDSAPGYTGGAWFMRLWWACWRRVLSRRCLACDGEGLEAGHTGPLPSGRPHRCPRCYGTGRVAWP